MLTVIILTVIRLTTISVIMQNVIRLTTISAIMLAVLKLNVLMLTVIILSVESPQNIVTSEYTSRF